VPGKILPALVTDEACEACRAARHTALTVLRKISPAAASREAVAQAVAWESPLSHADQDDRGELTLVRAEAEALGVVAAGALTELGHRLVAGDGAGVVRQLGLLLPGVTDEATFGSDLTVVVVGSPSSRVTGLLDSCAVREGRGGATTWRISAASVRPAFDAGTSAAELESQLAAIATTDLPQPLAYLIKDVARRHGRLRVGPATSVVTSADTALLAEVAHDRALVLLGVRLVAPKVPAAEATSDELLAALRRAGYFPVADRVDPAHVVAGERVVPSAATPGPGTARREVLRSMAARRQPPVLAEEPVTPAELAERLVGRLADAEPEPSETERAVVGSTSLLSPAEVRQLAHAIDTNGAVTITYRSQSGVVRRRRIREIVRMANRLYAFCELRQDEWEFVIGNILSVRDSVPPDPTEEQDPFMPDRDAEKPGPQHPGPQHPAHDVRTEVRRLLESHWDQARGYCVPNPSTYPHLWLWDSCFHALVWAELGDDRAVTELDATLAGQLTDGLVPHMRYGGEPPDTFLGPLAATSSLAQPPMFGHTIRVLQQRGFTVPDATLARARRGFEWLWRTRRTDDGVLFVVHPWEAGNDHSPRWDDWGAPGRTRHDYDRAARTAWNKELMAATTFAADGAATWSSRFVACPAAFNAYTAFSMTELAEALDDDELRGWARELAEAIDEQLWMPGERLWADAAVVGGGASVRVPISDGTMAALVTRDAEKATAALDQLADPDRFAAPFGPTNVGRLHPAYDPAMYWRGAAWPNLNYLLWLALRRWDRADEARELAGRALRGALASGWAEYWNPETGEGLGARPQSWTGLVLPMLAE